MSDRPGVGGPARGAGVSPLDPAALSRLGGLCPFLSSVDGDWRAAAPAREHRCSAVAPPAALSPDKQRRLCLVDAHTTCATFLAATGTLGGDETATDRQDTADATAIDGARTPPAKPVRAPREITRWAIPRTAPVVLDRGRPSVAAVMAHRSVTQLALVLLMVLAFLVLALARLSADDRRSSVLASPSAAPGASAEATVLQTANAAASFRPTPSPSAGSSAATATPAASATASTAASPSPQRTYRVVAGDTLSGIAARFGVTVHALQVANGIADPSRLRIGVILVIP